MGTALDSGNTISLTREVIVELCRGKEMSTLPPEVRNVVAGEMLHQCNSTIITNEVATQDPMQSSLITVQVAEREQTLNHPEGLEVTGPKSIDEVAGVIHVQVIETAASEMGSSPHRIGEAGCITPNGAVQSRTRVLEANDGEEVTQNQSGEMGRDSSALKLKQICSDSVLPKSRERSGVRILKRRTDTMHPSGHVLRPSTLLKRNSRLLHGESSSRPSKRKVGPLKPRGRPRKIEVKENERAQIDFNPNGFFEVRVDQQHCANIAEACGLRIDQINDLLKEDNSHRTTLPVQNDLIRMGEELHTDSDQGEHISDFDPLTEDELIPCSD